MSLQIGVDFQHSKLWNWGDFQTDYIIKHNFDNLQVGALVQHEFYKDAVVAYFNDFVTSASWYTRLLR
jgi:hypothetical protein